MALNKKRLTELPKTLTELQKAIDSYFLRCEGICTKDEQGNVVFNKNGTPLYERVPSCPTITGLALAIGLPTRQAVLRFLPEDERYSLICRGVARVEEFAERQLLESGTAGVKFFLSRSFVGWGEEEEGCEASPLSGLSEEKLAEYIEKLSGGNQG